MHSYAMRLHNSRVAVAVDNKSRKIVALAMNKTECIVVVASNQANSLAHLPCRSQSCLPKLSIDGYVAERKHAYSYAANLEHADSYKVASRCENTYNLALVHVVVYVGYRARENPWVETFKALFLTFL